MLSVQTAGYAGMERLGVPTRTTLNSPPDDRGQYSCRMRVETLPAREILVRSETVIRSNSASSSCTSACVTTANSGGSKNPQQQQQQQQQKPQQLLKQEHHNQHSHHQQHHHHQQHQHQQYQQLHHHQHHHHQQQHYQRMSAQQQENQNQQQLQLQQQQSECSDASNVYNGNLPPRSSASISNNNSCSNFLPDGIEAATLKYGSMGSRTGGGGGGSYGSSMSGSSCCSNSSCNSHSIDHHQHYQQGNQLKQQRTPHCPHHVPLPDSEWGQDRNMQIRAGYQQSEITRSYIKPPPNKSIKDVPEQSSYNFNALSALGGSNITLYAAPVTAPTQPQQQQQPQKSKPNVISKLFSRKSSPKSPTALSTSSSSASAHSTQPTSASITSMPASASSSASSLASAIISGSAQAPSATASSSPAALATAPLATMPISTAATLKTTACNYGASSLQTSVPPTITAGLAPSTQLLTTIGVSPAVTPAAMERIPTPPLSVTVPIGGGGGGGGYHHHQHLHHQHYNQQQQRLYQLQQQQMLLDSIVAESATPTTSLQSLKSSSCNLATAGAAERNSSRGSLVAMDCHPQTQHAAAGSVTPRSRTPTAPAADKGCNCNCKDCKSCAPNATT